MSKDTNNNKVSIREFAKQQGISHTAIQKAISTGKIRYGVSEDGKILPDVAIREMKDFGIGPYNPKNQQEPYIDPKTEFLSVRYGVGNPPDHTTGYCGTPQDLNRLMKEYFVELSEIMADIVSDLDDMIQLQIMADDPHMFRDAMLERITDKLEEYRDRYKQ